MGERLAEVRKDHGETQQQLADHMNVTKYSISNWEQGKSEPSHELLIKLCRHYQISSDYLLGLSNVDPAYVQKRRMTAFTQEEQEMLQKVENYLIWRRRNGRKKK